MSELSLVTRMKNLKFVYNFYNVYNLINVSKYAMTSLGDFTF